jgi:hypothetical protein
MLKNTYSKHMKYVDGDSLIVPICIMVWMMIVREVVGGVVKGM